MPNRSPNRNLFLRFKTLIWDCKFKINVCQCWNDSFTAHSSIEVRTEINSRSFYLLSTYTYLVFTLKKVVMLMHMMSYIGYVEFVYDIKILSSRGVEFPQTLTLVWKCSVLKKGRIRVGLLIRNAYFFKCKCLSWRSWYNMFRTLLENDDKPMQEDYKQVCSSLSVVNNLFIDSM